MNKLAQELVRTIVADPNALKELAYALQQLPLGPKNLLQTETFLSWEQRVTQVFRTIGAPPHVRGYSFSRIAIIMAIEKPTVMNFMARDLYPAIVAQCETTSTPSKVERAIRHFVEKTYECGDMQVLNQIFRTGKPSNSKFIATIADMLKQEDV